ncbi:hypothetical protein EYF80_013151 [Liparis tanakae]|uniref:Uncharacterized protein n=1 Tax=Liparis tanakae TaxID=230148 RepID=A0A4Z2IF86_9TELE|nr:hypothetical protein EYF80_013151 [Liparis tanakae]
MPGTPGSQADVCLGCTSLQSVKNLCSWCDATSICLRVSISSRRSAHDSFSPSFHSAMVAASEWPQSIISFTILFTCSMRCWPTLLVSEANLSQYCCSSLVFLCSTMSFRDTYSRSMCDCCLMELLTRQPGLHFSRLAVVLLSLQRGIQHHAAPLRLQLQNLPQLAHVPGPFAHKLHLGSPQRSDDPRAVQNLLDASPPPGQLPLECLKDRSEVLGDLVHLFGSQQDAASLLQRLNEADDSGLRHARLLAAFPVTAFPVSAFPVTCHHPSLGKADPLQATQLSHILVGRWCACSNWGGCCSRWESWLSRSEKLFTAGSGLLFSKSWRALALVVLSRSDQHSLISSSFC